MVTHHKAIKVFHYSGHISANSDFYHFGDNCIQNFHLGRYIVRYMVGNLVLRGRVSGAVKRDFRTYIRRYTPQMKILNMVIPILMYY